jgi:predicted Zn-ribbon and HTH transcriptional regulator
MVADDLTFRPSWADRVFLFACENNLDPPHRCPRCLATARWGLGELQALIGGRVDCRRCGFDFAGDRRRRPLRYALE